VTAPVASKTPPPDAQPPSNPPPDTRPPDNRPPRNPPADKRPPSSQRLAADLDTVTLLLRTAQLVADRRLTGVDPAARMALTQRLRLARRAVADIQGFTLPPTPAPPTFEVGTARPYHASRH
jgi:hypothetical protein